MVSDKNAAVLGREGGNEKETAAWDLALGTSLEQLPIPMQLWCLVFHDFPGRLAMSSPKDLKAPNSMAFSTSFTPKNRMMVSKRIISWCPAQTVLGPSNKINMRSSYFLSGREEERERRKEKGPPVGRANEWGCRRKEGEWYSGSKGVWCRPSYSGHSCEHLQKDMKFTHWDQPLFSYMTQSCYLKLG